MFRTIFRTLIWGKKEQLSFFVLLAFIATIALSRLIVYGIDHGALDALPVFGHIYIKGIHIHHFVFGVMLLILTSLASLLPSLKAYERLRAIVFGVGLGLVIDEFGILITLNETYWIRLSRDAIVATIILFINIIYAHRLWKEIGKAVWRIIKRPFTRRG